MRSALREVLDIGVWTFGLVSIAALTMHVGSESGVVEAVLAAVALAVGVFVLGVTGFFAVGTVDDRLGDREGWSE